MLYENPEPDVLNLLEKIQEATTSNVDEERGSFEKGDKVTYNMLGGALSNSDLIKMLGANEHALRVNHDGTLAEIVETMGEEVSRYSIQFEDGFTVTDVAVSEIKAVVDEAKTNEAEKDVYIGASVTILHGGHKGEKGEVVDFTLEGEHEIDDVEEGQVDVKLASGKMIYVPTSSVQVEESKTNEAEDANICVYCKKVVNGDKCPTCGRGTVYVSNPEKILKDEQHLKSLKVKYFGEFEESKTNEAEEATQTMKPQEKPNLSAEDLHMEDYSEEDLNKPEAKIKSKSEESGDAIRAVEDDELEQKEDEVVKPKNESKLKEKVEPYVRMSVRPESLLKRYIVTWQNIDEPQGKFQSVNLKAHSKEHAEAKALDMLKRDGVPEEFIEIKAAELVESEVEETDSSKVAHDAFVSKADELLAKAEKLEKEAGELKKKAEQLQNESKVEEESQLNMGIEIEKEHTDDPAEAKKIAKDHLKEDPKYYTKLKKMEAGACDEAVAIKDELKDKVVVAYKKYRETGKSREEAVQRTKKDFEDVTAPEIRNILNIEGVKESKFSFMKKQKPLWLCNECFKTFRADECACTFCESTDAENLLEGYGDLAGSTKEVFKVTWKNTETGKEESIRVMAFDKEDAKKEVEKNPKKRVSKVEGPIKSAEKGNEAPFEQVSEGSDLQESVSELVGETPGIDIENQKILNWAIEKNIVSNEWPSVEQMIDVVAGLDVIDKSGVEDSDGLDLGEIEAVYLKYILLPKATAAYAKSVSESFDYTEQEGVPKAGRTYLIQSSSHGWKDGNYKVTEVEWSRTLRGDLGKYFKVEGDDTWWPAKLYNFKEIDVEEAKIKESIDVGELGFISLDGQIEFADEEHRDVADEGLAKYLKHEERAEMRDKWGTEAWIDTYSDLSGAVRYSFTPDRELIISLVQPVTSSQMSKIKYMADLVDYDSLYFDIKELDGSEQAVDLYKIVTSGTSFPNFVKELRKYKLIKEGITDEAKDRKEVEPFRTIEIVKSQLDPDMYNIRVVSLPKGDIVILDTKPNSKAAMARGKELADTLNAKFLGIIDEKKLKEQRHIDSKFEEGDKVEALGDTYEIIAIGRDYLIVKDSHGEETTIKKSDVVESKLQELTNKGVELRLQHDRDTDEWVVVYYENGKRNEDKTCYTGDKEDAEATMAAMQKQVDAKTPGYKIESKLKEQEEDSFTTIAKGITDKADAEKLANEKDGQVVVDEDDEKKFAVIMKEE